MSLVLMKNLACNEICPKIHIIMLVLSVIIKPVQATYHHINIHTPASMVTHAANSKANADTIIGKMKWIGGGKI